jgi:hypothetical protein
MHAAHWGLTLGLPASGRLWIRGGNDHEAAPPICDPTPYAAAAVRGLIRALYRGRHCR